MAWLKAGCSWLHREGQTNEESFNIKRDSYLVH